jgi:outer membrane protein assembly factor BamD (BamD/ComL family)
MSGLSAERPEQGVVAPAPRRSAAADASDTDRLELGLLQRVRAAVAAGEFSAALDSIAEHQRRFPAGRLREEREALRIKALAGLGRNDEARRAAERFRERFPRSVLSTRIEETARPKP